MALNRWCNPPIPSFRAAPGLMAEPGPSNIAIVVNESDISPVEVDLKWVDCEGDTTSSYNAVTLFFFKIFYSAVIERAGARPPFSCFQQSILRDMNVCPMRLMFNA